MDKLVLDTRKSLYEPVEIVINEKTYQSQKLTRSVLTAVNELDEKVAADDDEALYQQVKLLFGIDEKLLNKLDKREVEDIVIFVKKKFAITEKERLEREIDQLGKHLKPTKKPTKTTVKNGKRSGGKA